MYKLIRFYNQNRRKIWITILIIVFILGIIQLLNYLTKVNKEKNGNQITNVIETNNTNKELISNKSAITGESVLNAKLKNDTEVISEFVKYCNEQSVNLAYEMLSEECKEEMFPTIEDFNNIYYSKIFGENRKIYTIENWLDNIYQVKFTQDILSTGNLTNNETKQDYITITKENGEKKLNINNYVGRKNLNKSTEYKNVKITVSKVDTYMDYEIYNLVIENSSESDILLDTSDDTKSVYLLDNKDMKYYFYSNEIVGNKLIVESKFTRNLQIKFSNSYSSNRKINKLVFSKFILNYDEYKILENKQEYDNFYQYRVNV